MTTHSGRHGSDAGTLHLMREAARERGLFWVATFTGIAATLTAIAALMVSM